MNGIDRITQRITQDNDREIAELASQAKAQADAITADYAQRAQREAEEILAKGEAAAGERKERLASMAQMEAKKARLAVKQEMLDRAFDRALKKLIVLPEADRVQLLAKLAAEASVTGKEELILAPQDRAESGEKVVAAANRLLGEKGHLTLSSSTKPIRGGLILSDGAVEVNCTFETLIRLQRTQSAGEVAAILFGA